MALWATGLRQIPAHRCPLLALSGRWVEQMVRCNVLRMARGAKEQGSRKNRAVPFHSHKSVSSETSVPRSALGRGHRIIGSTAVPRPAGAGLPARGRCAYSAGMTYLPTLESLNAHPVPEWFEDAKFGIFIHW